MSAYFEGFTKADIQRIQEHHRRSSSSVSALTKNSTSRARQPMGVNNNTDLTEVHVTDNVAKVIDSSELKQPVPPPPVESPTDVTLVHHNGLIDFSDFDVKQRLIEEQNRAKKEDLIRTLTDRSQRTKAEFLKLSEIRQEVDRLDVRLSSDVHVLRRNIDDVSMQYMAAEKRFLRMEREYLDAKLQMQKLGEKKDLLTEHLCTVIVKNEERKAAKLSELMLKLDMRNENSGNKVQTS